MILPFGKGRRLNGNLAGKPHGEAKVDLAGILNAPRWLGLFFKLFQHLQKLTSKYQFYIWLLVGCPFWGN